MKKIFISSTFKDMQSERDILHEKVLPIINEKLKELGETAIGVDLRWGISTDKMSEEEAELKAFSVCFDEIDDSRPYFIAFLGERYGYPVKKAIIDKIIPALKYSNDFKSMQSALFNKDEDRSITELEIRYGCFLEKIPKDHFLFFFRNELDLSKADKETKDTYLGTAGLNSLNDLKQAIIEEFSEEACVPYSASFNEDGELDVPDEEIKRIEEALYRMLVGDNKVIRNHYDLLLEQIDKRAKDRHQFYFGRNKEFNALNDFINDKNNQIMVVSGKSGSGKTTFLTEAYYRNKESGDIFIYVPIATDNSLDSDFEIMEYINHCLFKQTNIQFFRIKKDELSLNHFIDDFSRGIHEFAVKYNGDRKIVLMLDGVDRLYASNVISSLCFLTAIILNKYPFKTIVSTATDTNKMQVMLDMAKASYLSINQVSDEEAISIVNLKFKTYGKELTETLKQAILNKTNAHECIYLAALVERLLMINRHDFFTIYAQEKNKANIDYREQHLLEAIQSFPDDLNEAIIQTMKEGAKIAKSNVSQAFYCLSLSSNGLDADEINIILGMRNYYADKGKVVDLDNIRLTQKYFEFDYADFLIVKRYLSSFFEETPDGNLVFSHPLYRDAFYQIAKNDRYLVSATLEYHKANYEFENSFASLVSLSQNLNDYDKLFDVIKKRLMTINDEPTWKEVDSLVVSSLTNNTSNSFVESVLKRALEFDFPSDQTIDENSLWDFNQEQDDDFAFLANVLLSVYGFDNAQFTCPPTLKTFIEDLTIKQQPSPFKALVFVVAISLFANHNNIELIKNSLPLLKLIIDKSKHYLLQYAVSAYIKVAEALDLVEPDYDYIEYLRSEKVDLDSPLGFRNYCDINRLIMPIDKKNLYGPDIILYYASVAGIICRTDKVKDYTFKGFNHRQYSNLFSFVVDTVLSSYVRFWAMYLKCFRIDTDFKEFLSDFYEINRMSIIAARRSYDVPLLKAILELSKTFIEVYHRAFQNIDTHDGVQAYRGEFKNHIRITNRLSRALFPDQNGLISKEALINEMKCFAYLIMDDGSLPSASDFDEIMNAVNEYNDSDIYDGFLFLNFVLDAHYVLAGESGDISSIAEYLQILIEKKNIDYDLVVFVCDTLRNLSSEEESFHYYQIYVQLFQQGYHSNYQYNLQSLNYFTRLYETLDDETKMSILASLKTKDDARTFAINFLSSAFLAALADFDLTDNYWKLITAYNAITDLASNIQNPSEEENGLISQFKKEYEKRDIFSITADLLIGNKPLEICERVSKAYKVEKQDFYAKYPLYCFYEAMLGFENDFENQASIAAMCNRVLDNALSDHPSNHILISKGIVLQRYIKHLFEENDAEMGLNEVVLRRWYFLSAGIAAFPRQNDLLLELIDDIKKYTDYGYDEKQIAKLSIIFEQASLFFNGLDKLPAAGYNAAIYVLYHQCIFSCMARNEWNYCDAYTKIMEYYRFARKQHIKLNKTSYLCLRELYLLGETMFSSEEFMRSFRSKKAAWKTVDRLMNKYQPYINVYPEIFFMKK